MSCVGAGRGLNTTYVVSRPSHHPASWHRQQHIEFPDNQDVLDLIESRKPAGIFALIDEQCLPRHDIDHEKVVGSSEIQ